MEGCTSQCKAMRLLVFGIILLVARLYTTLDIWVVIAALLISKAILLFIVPVCPCSKKAKRRR